MKHIDYWMVFGFGVAMTLGSAFHWLPYSLTETLGFVTGAACVYLVVKEHIWNFPIGIANNLFFLVLFGQARLYGDAGLQVIFMFLGIQGWYVWLYGGKNRTHRQIAHATPQMLGLVTGFVLFGTYGLTQILHRVSGAAPLLDAFTTVLSLAAQYLLNCKLIENWYIWILANIIYIYLYLHRGLQLTAILYVVFLCLCIAGLINWTQTFKKQFGTLTCQSVD